MVETSVIVDATTSWFKLQILNLTLTLVVRVVFYNVYAAAKIIERI